jgi:hypothetical protein
MGTRLPDVVVSLGAGLGLVTTYAVPTRFNIGPEGRWWESVREGLSHLGGAIDKRMGPRSIVEAEYAGTLDMPPALADELLWERGFVRNPFSRLKTLDGLAECGSWVYRESPLASRQLHVMLFPSDDVRTHVYAHEEASSVNPLVGVDHVDGDGQNVAEGVEWARSVLPLEIRKDTEDPPAGPWSDAIDGESTEG